jgi:hypothetical protein
MPKRDGDCCVSLLRVRRVALDHAYRSGFKPGTNVGAGCSCHPTGPTIIARFAFLYILSGQGQLHAYQD